MRRLLACPLLAVVLYVPQASAQEPTATQLMSGVTFQQFTALTSHGPVAYSVITAPQPTGLTAMAPVLGEGKITGPRETLTQLEESVDQVTTVAGVNGDFFTVAGGHSTPSGIVMSGGALERIPTPAKSSIGFDSNGVMHVGRISFTGTWQGTGQRRPLAGVNQQPRGDQTVLFTPAWGAEAPSLPNGSYAVLEPFPTAAIDTDLRSTVSAVGSGPVAIPSDGAVLVSNGGEAAKLQGEAAQGTGITVRLILPDSWSAVVSALGGGPQLVKGGKPVFSTGENFSTVDLATRQPRTAVGQLADGHVILVTVDGGRPGYSVGMTNYELAETMAKLGAVTAAGLQFGRYVTAAFEGRVLNRLSQLRQTPVKEGLLVEYAGVFLPPPSLSVVGKADAATGERLSYRITSQSTVTASVIGPDGTSHPVDSGSRQAGTYSFTWNALDTEGTWHWSVQATDAQNRTSTADETFTYDLTLSGLTVPRRVSRSDGLGVAFTLSRPASATLTITAPNGTLVTSLPPQSLAAGPQTLTWDGTTSTGARAPLGDYVATVTDTSSIGTAAYSARFTLAG